MASSKHDSARSQFALLTLASLLLCVVENRHGYGEDPADKAGQKQGYLVQVPLPITGSVDTKVIGMLQRLQNRLPQGGPRPVLVLEFSSPDGNAGDTSQFERSLALARFLSSSKLSRLRTVAYIPKAVKGHAVLAVMACNEIVMREDAELGEAGISEPVIEDSVRNAYKDIAQRRGLFPVPFALAMLDRQLAVYRVKVGDGVRYVFGDELEQLEREGKAVDVETVSHAGELPSFKGRELRNKYRFVSRLVSGRRQLATELGLPPYALEGDPSLGESWEAVKIELMGKVQSRNVSYQLRGLREAQRDRDINFVLVWVDSEGGSPEDSFRMANELAKLDPVKIRTVAYIPNQARADAALVAMACDHVVMSEKAMLGGFGEQYKIPDQAQSDLLRSIKSLAKEKQQDWSLMAALVDPRRVVYQYRTKSGQTRYLTEEEHATLDDPDVWLRGREVSTRQGMTGREAESIHVARYLVDDFGQFKSLYHLKDDPPLVEPSWAEKWTRRVAEELAKPWIASWLLFAAMFLLSIEFSHPGLSAPGFLSGVCFLLFFWSQYWNETAGLLEILLFAAGVICVLLEIFVIPGFGIFGVGGVLMILASIVLASQSFIFPTNSEQMKQLPVSLSMVGASLAGVVAAGVFIRKFLPHTPFFRRMMLEPPLEDNEELQQRESLVHWEHLTGKRGVTTTQLTPSGKARFGDDVLDVISDGEVIAKGSDVYVAEVRGNRVLVLPLDQQR